MSVADHIDKISRSVNEHELGYSYEYYDPEDGQIKLFNVLDYKAAQNYVGAGIEEQEIRGHNYMITVTVLTLTIMIVLLVMLVIYINTTANMTGIYYDKNGNKIEVYHNKTVGDVEFQYGDGRKSHGYLKKINSNTFGLYLDEDQVVGKYSLAAYVDARDRTWSWKNNKWIMD